MDIANSLRSKVSSHLARYGASYSPEEHQRLVREVFDPFHAEATKVLSTSRDIVEIRFAQGAIAASHEFLRLIGQSKD